jgi:hypothetical protein
MLLEREENPSEKNEPTCGLHLSEGKKERGYRFKISRAGPWAACGVGLNGIPEALFQFYFVFFFFFFCFLNSFIDFAKMFQIKSNQILNSSNIQINHTKQ